ncbi:unnamed protein product [Dibothriocephalus latus]|uniref:Uncharacterized protein n=1 Tax=Dibothriocephalus latus TaxID=60516 RepID=A0A3P7L9C1_DIBLA|nr:unnamed protein product [Dibothriocephalus latus]
MEPDFCAQGLGSAVLPELCDIKVPRTGHFGRIYEVNLQARANESMVRPVDVTSFGTSHRPAIKDPAAKP